MPEINIENCWKVTMIEYDNGVQRPMGTKYFDNEQEAKNFCSEYAWGSSDCYFRATYSKV